MTAFFHAKNRTGMIALILAMVLVFGFSEVVPAQTDQTTWSPPENLSRSGYTSDPVMVIASTGTLYAVWADSFQGAIFAERTDGVWSAPAAATFPWSDGFISGDPANPVYTPQLIADDAGLIHAIWIDAEQSLYHSYIAADAFGRSAWATTQQIDESVIQFDARIDGERVIHLTYVSVLDSENFPAGVYYTSRNPFSNLWNASVRLYDSPYIRGLTAGDIEVNVLVVDNPDGDPSVFAAWDNRPRRQLFIARSGNNGANWDAPVEVLGPDSILDTQVPAQVALGVFDNRVLLIWKESEIDLSTSCVQYYQVFELDGTPVTTPQFMLQELSGCPLDRQTLISTAEALILQTEVFDEIYLVGWNGERWSVPQVQLELANFTDAETFQTILLACVQAALDSANQLYLIGCDAGAAQDIWFMNRPLANVQNWFSEESTWSSLTTLSSTEGIVSSVSLEAGAGNLLHAIWAQSSSSLDESKTIRYARWDGLTWTFIITIFEPPFGKVDFLTTALDERADRLYLIWNGGERGELYFTWANAELAGSTSEWAPPILLSMGQQIGSSADVHVGWSGEVFVGYTVPVNEGRGVYLTRSTDNGIEWSVPVQIMDGAGWEIVGKPDLTQTTDGVLHLLVERLPPPEGSLQKQLYYSRSMDDGLTWSPPAEVMTGDALLASIGTHDGQSVFRLWQEKNGALVTNYFDRSSDNGSTWADSANFIGLASDLSGSDVSIDAAGHLHLVQIAEGDLNNLRLQEWVWDGAGWNSQEIAALGNGQLSDNSSVAVEVMDNGYLGFLVSIVDRDNPAGMELAFTARELVLTAPPITIVTPIPQPTATADIPTPEAAAATPTQELAAEPVVPESGNDDLLVQLFVGFLIAILVVSVAFFVINRVARRT